MAIADDKKSNTNITTLTKTNNSHAILHEVVKPYLRKDDIDDQHLLATQAQQYHKASNSNSNSNSDSVVSKEVNQMPSVSKSMNLTLSLFVPICFIACILLWVLYAYRNPHTKSGQLLIQVSKTNSKILSRNKTNLIAINLLFLINTTYLLTY